MAGITDAKDAFKMMSTTETRNKEYEHNVYITPSTLSYFSSREVIIKINNPDQLIII